MPASDVYRAIWRHRILIILLTAIAGVGAYFYSASQPKVYEAESLVRIQQRGLSVGDAYGSVSSLELGQRLAQTYALIVTTRQMRVRVTRALNGSVPFGEVHLDAAPVGDVELLAITARNGDPQVAATVANATAVALKTFITETGTLRDQIVVVDKATPPDYPVSPRPKLALGIAVMLALLLNIVLALLLEFFSDRLPEIDEFEERFGHPVLATIPGLSLRERDDIRGAPASTLSVRRVGSPAGRDAATAAAAAKSAWPTSAKAKRGSRGN